jgi:DNA-binding transcriptional MerR regulator
MNTCSLHCDMTINYAGEKFYNTKEVCDDLGITRTILNKWLRQGIINNAKDKKMYTEEDVDKLKSIAQKRKPIEQIDLFYDK